MIRLDANVIWIYPRPSHEMVPSAVSEVDIRSGGFDRDIGVKVPKVRLRVTRAGHVAQMVRWFDALPVVAPDVGWGPCSLGPGPYSTFDFRSADGTTLASAGVPIYGSGPCAPIDFSIGVKKQLPLVDKYVGPPGPSFLERVEKLLGVSFMPS